MTITFTENILNTRYRDDYLDSDNYYRILFNKGRALQARELTQMQTILQNQIERFGRNIFKEGASVVPGGATLDDTVEFVKLNTTTNAFPTDGSEINETFTGQNSGVKVRVLSSEAATGSDPATLFVTYTNTLSGTTGSTPIRLSAGEDIVGDNTGTTLTVQTTNTPSNPAVGKGVKFSISEGSFFVNGFFVYAQSQSLIISKYTPDVTIEVGFKLIQEIVTSDDDSGLYDNSGSVPNTTAPGADRYRIKLVLTTKDDIDSDETFVYLAKLVNSEVKDVVTGFNQYNKINDLLALRTKEESGNYIVKPFKISFDSDADDNTKLDLNVSDGTAYVNGYRAAKPIPSTISMNRARDTLLLENEVVAANYGNYVIVESLLGLPNIHQFGQVNLRNNATYGSGSTIGTARVRAIDAAGNNTYRLYLFNISMNSGSNFRDVRSIGTSAEDNAACVLENSIAVLKDANNESLIFPLPEQRPSNIEDISLQVQRRFLVTADSAGAASLNLSATGETFSNTTDWIVSVDSSGEIISPTISGSGATSASITSAPTGSLLEIIAYVNKSAGQIRSKTDTETTDIASIESDGSGVKYVDLGLVDVYDYSYIRDDSANGKDISHKFTLDGGQRDAYYGLGRLVLKGGQTQNNSVAYKIKHFTHGATGDFFGINSYSGFNYARIPSHTLKDGTTIDLRNYLDFRPTVNSSNTFTGGTARINELPKNTDLINADVTYYLPRYDRLILDENGNVSVLEGVSSLDPKFKEIPENSIELYRFRMNPYSLNDSDMDVQYVETKGYTMKDINNIEKRVDRLEETTALTLLELDTSILEVLDSSGNNRTKSGFLADNFVDHFHSLVGNPEYRASINPQKGTLNTAFVEKNVGLVYDSDESTNTIIKGDNIYIKYDEEEWIVQDKVSRTENVNPYAAFQFNGQLIISPASDEWRDVTIGTRIIDGGSRIPTNQELLAQSIEWNWNGVDRETGEAVSRVVSNRTIRTLVDDRVLDIAIAPFIRSRRVFFKAAGLRPNTKIIPYFDQVDVSTWCRATTFQNVNAGRTEFGNTQNNATTHPDGSSELFTDAGGEVEGSFFIPNTSSIQFRTGAREFTLLDITAYDPDNSTSVATAIYTAEGVLETRQQTIISTRLPPPPAPPPRPRRPRRIDPIAQSFYVSEEYGAFITKVRLFFKTKSDDMPVWVQIRPMVNGHPSDTEIIPGSVKILQPANVAISDDASSPTDFEFDEPLYLAPNTEYCVVVMADTTDYNVFIAKMGEFILNTTTARVAKQPTLGSFFKSQNAMTWDPAQDEDLMFTLYRADFDTATDGIAYLRNDTLPNRLLNSNPISTILGDSDVYVAHKDHGFSVGDEVTIQGVSEAVGGIPAISLNGVHTITEVDGFGYKHTHTSAATSTNSGGGSAVLANENAMFDVLYPYIQTISPDKTGLLFNGKFHSGKSFAGTETPYLEDATQTALNNRGANYFSNPKVVANSDKEGDLGTETAKMYVTMTTENSYVSPVLDLQRASLSMINHRIDKQAAAAATGFNVPIDYVAETDPQEGSHMSKHITKPVTLVNDAVGLKILISANRPSVSDFDVYYKTLGENDVISDVNWVLASKEANVPSDENREVYRDYRYLVGGDGGSLDPFTIFQIKIVFKSTNSSKVPTIKDLRVIALGV